MTNRVTVGYVASFKDCETTETPSVKKKSCESKKKKKKTTLQY